MWFDSCCYTYFLGIYFFLLLKKREPDKICFLTHEFNKRNPPKEQSEVLNKVAGSQITALTALDFYGWIPHSIEREQSESGDYYDVIISFRFIPSQLLLLFPLAWCSHLVVIFLTKQLLGPPTYPTQGLLVAPVVRADQVLRVFLEVWGSIVHRVSTLQ